MTPSEPAGVSCHSRRVFCLPKRSTLGRKDCPCSHLLAMLDPPFCHPHWAQGTIQGDVRPSMAKEESGALCQLCGPSKGLPGPAEWRLLAWLTNSCPRISGPSCAFGP